MHMTVFAAFLAEAGVAEIPLTASAIAATARVAPDTIEVFTVISLEIRLGKYARRASTYKLKGELTAKYSLKQRTLLQRSRFCDSRSTARIETDDALGGRALLSGGGRPISAAIPHEDRAALLQGPLPVASHFLLEREVHNDPRRL